LILSIFCICGRGPAAQPSTDILFADFEGADCGDWKLEGNAFVTSLGGGLGDNVRVPAAADLPHGRDPLLLGRGEGPQTRLCDVPGFQVNSDTQPEVGIIL